MPQPPPKTFTNLSSLVNFLTTPASPGSPPQDLLLPPIKSLVKVSYNPSVILELMIQHVVVVVKSLVKVYIILATTRLLATIILLNIL